MTHHPEDVSKTSRDNSEQELEQKPLRDSGEFVVKYYPTPPRAPANKGIHPRRPLPRVPEKAMEKPEDKKKD